MQRNSSNAPSKAFFFEGSASSQSRLCETHSHHQSAMIPAVERVLWKLGRVFRLLGRCPSIGEPCCGIGGMRTWVETSKVPYESCCAYDFDPAIEAYYKLMKLDGVSGLDAMACGPKLGDVTRVAGSSLPDCEIYISGPPCQPYAPNGQGGGFADERSEVLEICVTWLIELAWRGSLVCFLLENSPSLATHSYFWSLINQLQMAIPFFKLEVVEQDLKELLPHSRPRLWVRGLRRDCLDEDCDVLPPPAKIEEIMQEKPKLLDFLDPTVPNLDPNSLTDNMKANLAAYKAMAKQAKAEGTSGQVMCCELDRNPLRQYGGAVSFDCIPSLRSGGPKIFLISLDDVHAEWSKQRVHRFLTVEERFSLQGHSPELSKYFKGPSAAVKGTGNAFNVVHVAAMLSPLLEAAARHGVISKQCMQRLSPAALGDLVPAKGCEPCPSLKRISRESDTSQKRRRVSCKINSCVAN